VRTRSRARSSAATIWRRCATTGGGLVVCTLGTTSSEEMTSPTLRVLVERVVAGLFPSIPVRDRSKADILAEVLAKHGWPAVLAVGAELRLMADHPVVQGVVAPADPRAVLERWILLERFSHSDNRVEVVDASATHLTLRHVAGDGGVIPAANDLFVWGLLLSLFDLAGASDLRASFGRAESIALAAAPGAMTRSGGLPAETHVATFRWTRGSSEVPALPARACRRGVPARALASARASRSARPLDPEPGGAGPARARSQPAAWPASGEGDVLGDGAASARRRGGEVARRCTAHLGRGRLLQRFRRSCTL